MSVHGILYYTVKCNNIIYKDKILKIFVHFEEYFIVSKPWLKNITLWSFELTLQNMLFTGAKSKNEPTKIPTFPCLQRDTGED